MYELKGDEERKGEGNIGRTTRNGTMQLYFEALSLKDEHACVKGIKQIDEHVG